MFWLRELIQDLLIFVVQNVYMNLNTMLAGYHGSFVHTVASATDGIKFTAESGDNWASGKVRLYGLKK